MIGTSSSMICHQIEAARKEGKDLHVVFLDLANTSGSVSHSLFPEKISVSVKAHFEDIQLCFNTSDYTTFWQDLEIVIMAGCIISTLAFTMTMEVIIRASKWDVGGERLARTSHLSLYGQHDHAYYNCSTYPLAVRQFRRQSKLGKAESET